MYMSQLPIQVRMHAISVDASYWADAYDVAQGNHRNEGWVFTNSVWVPIDNTRSRMLRLDVRGRFHPLGGDQRLAVTTLLGRIELPSWDAARLYDIRDDPTWAR
jgi:hypothetical protein